MIKRLKNWTLCPFLSHVNMEILRLNKNLRPTYVIYSSGFLVLTVVGTQRKGKHNELKTMKKRGEIAHVFLRYMVLVWKVKLIFFPSFTLPGRPSAEDLTCTDS